jgi:Arc/MetJ-type ribon-helix-helix transcriptional regulator
MMWYDDAMNRHVTVRLDEDAAAALRLLMRDGVSRSDAIRDALVTAARRRRAGALAAEAAELANDTDDLAEMAEVAELMEELRAPR